MLAGKLLDILVDMGFKDTLDDWAPGDVMVVLHNNNYYTVTSDGFEFFIEPVNFVDTDNGR